MSYATIDDLRSQLGARQTPEHSAAYAEKMLHALPETKVVADRVAYLLEHVRGKRVLEFGATGPASVSIRQAAADYFGVDRTADGCVVAFDLDDVHAEALPAPAWTPEIVVCGEVLEHLSNPGWFLTRLRRQHPAVPVILTVPNAFSSAAQKWLGKGYENVNRDHVAWYSPKTLSVLLERVGYTQADLAYYNGTGPTAEGLIVVAE